MVNIPKLRISLLLGSTALSLGLPLAAPAQEGMPFSLDPIIVEQRDPIGATADGATSVYVADAELERASLGDLKDLFSGISSVAVGGAIPVAQKIFVNGIDMLNLAISVDGVSQSNRVLHHASANAFDPGLMKFVRVDPGVAPADAGPNAVAGAVVMEAIDVADLLENGGNFGGKLRRSYSDNGETFGTAVTVGTRSGGFEILGYGKIMAGENYADGNGDEVTCTAADLQSGLVKLAYETQVGQRVEFFAQQMTDEAKRNFRANFGPGGSVVVYDTGRTIFSLRYEDTNDSGMWDPQAVIGFSENMINAPLFEDRQGTSNTSNAKLQNTFHLSDENTITAGVDYVHRQSQYRDGVNPTLEEDSKNIGVFAQARIAPTDRLRISTGLPWGWQDFTGKDDTTYNPSGGSANASVVYDLTDALSVRAGYSTVFVGLQLEDNYNFFRAWDYSLLKSSRAQNAVAGVDWPQGGLTLGADVFVNKIDDVRNSDSTDDFEYRGFNLAGTYDWNSGFARLSFTSSEASINGDNASSFGVLDYGATL